MRRLASLKTWTHSKAVAREAYRATLQKPLERHFGLADQIRSAAVSVPANIVEGYALGTRPQFVRHIRIAFASACELSVHIEMARDLDLVPTARANQLLESCDLLIKLFIGLLKKISP